MAQFQVGDKVKALAYTDSSGRFHAEVTGLYVDSIRHIPESDIPAYDRLNCYVGGLGEALVKRYGTPRQIVQVEAAARFFDHDNE